MCVCVALVLITQYVILLPVEGRGVSSFDHKVRIPVNITIGNMVDTDTRIKDHYACAYNSPSPSSKHVHLEGNRWRYSRTYQTSGVLPQNGTTLTEVGCLLHTCTQCIRIRIVVWRTIFIQRCVCMLITRSVSILKITYYYWNWRYISTLQVH